MARIKKEEDFNVKRGEILDAAQRFIYTRGYAGMAVQDIVAALGISKGAFYHYFPSKPDLLNALIERSTAEILQALAPLIEDPALGALEKLQGYFSSAARWKIERKEYLLALLRVWYNDENALVRQKTYAAGLQVIAPLLTRVFEQGNREGVFHVDQPDRAGQALMALLQGVGETVARLILNLEGRPPREALREIQSVTAAYNQAIERVLGAPRGALNLFDQADLRRWVLDDDTHNEGRSAA